MRDGRIGINADVQTRRAAVDPGKSPGRHSCLPNRPTSWACKLESTPEGLYHQKKGPLEVRGIMSAKGRHST